jgi:hypothetical protein
MLMASVLSAMKKAALPPDHRRLGNPEKIHHLHDRPLGVGPKSPKTVKPLLPNQ